MSKENRKRLLVLMWFIAVASLCLSFASRLKLGMLAIEDVLGVLLFLGLGIIGTSIFRRYPSNPVGWVFFAAFCYLTFQFAAEAWLTLYLSRFSDLGLPSLGMLLYLDAYIQEILSVAAWYSLLIFPALYFPKGQLLSRRWFYLQRIVVVCLVLRVIAGAFNPGLISTRLTSFENPYAVPVAATIMAIVEVPLLLASVLAPISLLLRFRGAQGIERQQLKWPLFSGLLATIGIGLLILAVIANDVFGIQPGETARTIIITLEAFSVISFPFTIGLAILRYRLYDIDVIINRTLLYSALTGSLALVYFGSVGLLQTIFPVESPIAVVLSTLTVAALFAPLRRRIQDAIDRRFHRQRYDAARALAAFSATARDEVDIDKLSDALAKTVVQTLHPAQISLWLLGEHETLPGSARR